MLNLEKKINIDHILLHSTFQMVAGIVYGFGVFVLVERGYTSGQAGLCMSLASIFCLFVAPTISNYLDNSDKASAFEAIIITSSIVCLLYLINFFIGTKGLLLSIIFILCHGLYTTQEPSVNSMSSKFISSGLNIGFTTARAAGSFSYGLVCAIFGILTRNLSYKVALLGGFVFSLLMLLVTIRIRSNYHKHDKRDLESTSTIEEKISFKEFITNNKLFLVLCIFITGIFIGYTSTDNFMLVIVTNVGGNSSDMGLILAFKALLEAVAIYLFPKLLKRFKLEKLLIMASVCFVIKQLIITLGTSILHIYIGQCFQMLSFAMLFPGMVEYININLTNKETYRGNAIFVQTLSLGSIISSLVAGNVADKFGVFEMNATALIITIIGAIGFTLTIIYKNKKLKKI